MLSVSIKSETIKKYNRKIMHKIIKDYKENVEKLFLPVLNKKIKTSWFSSIIFKSSDEVISFIRIHKYDLSELSKKLLILQKKYFELSDEFVNLSSKLELATDMAHISNHVVFTSDEKVLVQLFVSEQLIDD